MGGGKISNDRTVLIIISLLLFIIAIGSVSAADMNNTVTNEDMGFDYTQENSEVLAAAGDSADISYEKNNLTDENNPEASGDEVLGAGNDDVLSASTPSLSIVSGSLTPAVDETVTVKVNDVSSLGYYDTVYVKYDGSIYGWPSGNTVTSYAYAAKTSDISFSFSEEGSHTISFYNSQISDGSENSESLTFVVGGSSDPEITLTPNTTAVYLGDTITLTGTLTGATGDITYKFSDGTASETHASGETFNYHPQASGNIRITASSGDVSKVLTLHVYPTVATYIETSDFLNRMVQGDTISITPKVYTFSEVECSDGTLSFYIDGRVSVKIDF